MACRSAALPLAVLAILSVAPAHALFLVSQDEGGRALNILCEGQDEVFVSSPGADASVVRLNSASQASITPLAPGPYTVQCGNETATVQASLEAPPAEPEPQGGGLLIAPAAAAFLAFCAALALAIARLSVRWRGAFEKRVEGGQAHLLLRPAENLENAAITDPVAFGFAGKPLEFRIAFIPAGREWRYSYEIEGGERALPASLEATGGGGKKVRLLSELRIEGRAAKAAAAVQGGAGGAKRSLPRAK